ncbi:hypothetical protein LTR56_008469 [Elasticomyces elasticus]|nr:hypothetical protein LTR56_008469 [Elasticomyces elasticus]KAK3653695.1 hypothetical protein LTR22_011072 [Elasticomyces elasticus]KAK4924196.1 hypothetical protein LTR49_008717 [Elasticomyces elasticus]KAK5758544.1 hypothetical protein LTS12_011408 [Elasticomyces elasticus]
MFASRTHNENAIYEQQTAAAGKPLNQGVKGLAPKTPGNKVPKTPFKANDENAAFGNGKTGGKAKEGGLFGGQGKGGKVDQSAFVTPAGPRTRAPLGNKTTNAKALLQTPAGTTTKLSATNKPTSPRLRRGKVKIHTAESDPLDNAVVEEEREIEYMPPREVPLPDHPEDCWPADRTYPQFEGKNLTRGWYAEFGESKRVLESDEEMSDFDEKCRKAEQGRKAREAKGAVERRLGTVKAKGAASALSSSVLPKQRAVPSFAAPTAAARARVPTVTVAKRAASGSTVGVGNSRHTAAKVASNTTLGYSKGRAVSASTRQPLSAVHEKPAVSRTDTAAAARNTTLDELLGMHSLSVREDGEGDDGFGGMPVEDIDDGLDDFQLDSVDA